jgi:hypothetical protein
MARTNNVALARKSGAKVTAVQTLRDNRKASSGAKRLDCGG